MDCIMYSMLCTKIDIVLTMDKMRSLVGNNEMETITSTERDIVNIN